MSAPAGWYPHPTMANTQRYWDGERWTEHIAPGLPPAYLPAKAASTNSHTGLIVAGVITALLLPVVGFVLGIVLIAKDKVGPGLGCMLLAIMAFIFWMNQLTPEPTTTYYNGY